MPISLPPLSRRRFLASSLAAGAGLLLPQTVFAEGAPNSAEEFLLMSDNHIGSHRDEERHGMKSAVTFEQARRDILQLPNRPKQVIVSGDCAMSDGRPGDYAFYGELLKPLRESGMSFHLALGNHDNRKNFLAAFSDVQSGVSAKEVPDKFISVVETTYANWFVLDSLEKTGKTAGLLGDQQLAWLEKSLDARSQKPALIVAHHNLNPLMKYKSLQDTRPLLNVLLARKHVKAYIFGHTHWWTHGQLLGLSIINLPTTAWPFSEDQPRGFVTATLRSDGATFKMHSLDQKHRLHGDKAEVKWKA
jgi:3',5'-cyclic AMP phosphodiesterase CpdA